MAVCEAIKHIVAEAKAAVEAQDRALYAQHLRWRDGQRKSGGGMFPSTEPGDRGATSPLGGLAGGVWSGKP
jgi:hypothetical protein